MDKVIEVEQTLTLVCKLAPTTEQVCKVDATLKGFADGCNYANKEVKASITGKNTIQNQVYQSLRQLFNLSANQAVRVCARVAANRKTAKLKGKPVKQFNPTSADFDARIFSFREKDWTVSLTLIGGRERIALDVGDYQKAILQDRKPTSAQLCKHKDGQYFIHIQLTNAAPEPIHSTDVLGVDFGRRDIAVTSDGQSWCGKQVQVIRDHFAKLRQSLQFKASKGTRSSRRRCRELLQRLSGRERRFQTWLNHTISIQLIRIALNKNAAIAIEDLTGIRERTNTKPRNKTERRRSNSWAFYQLRQFLEYKGIKYAVEVLPVPPQYTSQTCHKCLHIGLRTDKTFKCGHCGWKGDADYNGANVIRLLGLCVTQPRGPEYLCCSLSTDASGLLKAPAF